MKVDRQKILMTAGLFALGGAVAGRTAEAPRPNIIIILSDDMGFSDLGCYGGEIDTPRLDALARDGVRFSQFYNAARCCPSRASLLTGLYAHQAGVGHMVFPHGNRAGYAGELSRKAVTIAEALKPAGYRSYLSGKWHVTAHVGPEGPKDNWPLQRGFDRFYGTIHGAGSFFDPSTLTRDNTQISPFADPEYTPQTYYYTDAIAEHAVRFIADHQRDHAETPFFLYVAFTAPHWPMHALPEDIEKYRGQYDIGYDAVRKARHARLKEMGLVDPSWRAVETVGRWDAVEDKRWEAAGMEVYAAMVDRMDQGIGRIVDELKRTGALDNTLICYLNDNGGCAEDVGRSARLPTHPDIERPGQPTLPPMAMDALLQPVSIPSQTRDGYPVRMGRNVMPGAADTYVAYGLAWANVSNTPFREYKHWVHEGGIATPLVVHWPAGIPAGRRGRIEGQPGHLVDFMATCVELAGAAYPVEFKGQPIPPTAGTSLVPAFRGEPLARRDPLFWEHEGNRALRDGPWKLVAKGPGGRWELYDMERDRTELNDLATAEPERLKAMIAQWESIARRVGAIPWPWNPPYRPASSAAMAPVHGPETVHALCTE